MGVGQVLVSRSEYRIDLRTDSACPQAIRRLIEIALTTKSKRQSDRGEKVANRHTRIIKQNMAVIAPQQQRRAALLDKGCTPQDRFGTAAALYCANLATWQSAITGQTHAPQESGRAGRHSVCT